MCNKHKACSTQKINAIRPVSGACDAPTIAQVSTIAVTVTASAAEGCQSGDSCCGAEPEEPAASNSQQQSSTESVGLLKSWKVAGMDCPACARKVETATSRIQGVVNSKVMFATEKLVVRVNDASLFSQVEAAVADAGFTLNALDGSAVSNNGDVELTGWKKTFKDNAHILAISTGMVIAAAFKGAYPVISEWLFTLTCILGLMPIGAKAIKLAKSGTPFAIETLMSVAAIGALYLGETVEAAMVLLLFLIGERLEAFAASRARSGVQALMSLVPEEATVIIDNIRQKKSAALLEPGDIIEVAPGDRMPADGELLSANASFDESALTGESVPVERMVGDTVMAGAVLADKIVRLKVTSKQGETAIDRILHLIEEAASRRAPIERFLDQFSRW
jgi:Cd2+/Zn2+-exporting ATPase